MGSSTGCESGAGSGRRWGVSGHAGGFTEWLTWRSGQLRARGVGHRAALRQVANRLVRILHGCLRARTLYDQTTAWTHHHGTSTASNDSARLLAATT